MLHSLRSTFSAAALVLGLSFGAGAQAATVTSTSASLNTTDAGTSWQVDFICSSSLPCSGSPVGTLQGSALFTLNSVTQNLSGATWFFTLALSNTSAASVAGFIASMGFSTSPDAAMGTVTDSSADGIVFKGNTGWISGAYRTELCVTVGNNCTSAGSEHDMTSGVTDVMTFALTTFTGSSITLSDYAMKFQGNPNSYEMGGRTPSPVPLPAAGGLLLAGLGALAMLKRRGKAA